jgi:hypothetical protein
MQRKLKSDIPPKFRRIPLTMITCSIVPLTMYYWWSWVLAWWCLVLWLWFICLFVLIVGVLWVFYLQSHQLLCWVLLLYLPPHCYLSSFLLNPMEDVRRWTFVKQHQHPQQKFSSMSDINTWKMPKKRRINFFCYPLLFFSLPQFDYYQNNQEKMNMISRILPAPSIIYSRSLLILKFIHQPDGKRQPRWEQS